MLRLDLPVNPLALVTTSVAMSPALAAAREPQGPSDRLVLNGRERASRLRLLLGHGYHVLPHGLFVGRCDPTARRPQRTRRDHSDWRRNVYAPPWRRTGDYGRMDYDACPCGDPMFTSDRRSYPFIRPPTARP
jgi:hypothetical protein